MRAAVAVRGLSFTSLKRCNAKNTLKDFERQQKFVELMSDLNVKGVGKFQLRVASWLIVSDFE